MHLVLGSRSERGGARRAPTKRVYLKYVHLILINAIFQQTRSNEKRCSVYAPEGRLYFLTFSLY